jgi:Arc/MetJ-type ribon-helix-helix transcriptional regulator
MAERVTISIPDDRKDLLDWVDKKVEDGKFSSRSHGFWYAVKELKDGETEDVLV